MAEDSIQIEETREVIQGQLADVFRAVLDLREQAFTPVDVAFGGPAFELVVHARVPGKRLVDELAQNLLLVGLEARTGEFRSRAADAGNAPGSGDGVADRGGQIGWRRRVVVGRENVPRDLGCRPLRAYPRQREAGDIARRRGAQRRGGPSRTDVRPARRLHADGHAVARPRAPDARRERVRCHKRIGRRSGASPPTPRFELRGRPARRDCPRNRAGSAGPRHWSVRRG